MQETIQRVKQAESKAADILTAARSRAAEIISKKNSETAEKLNKFRSEELERFNESVKQAELKKQQAVDEVKSSGVPPDTDLESIADEVLKRVTRTIFD